MEKLVFIFIWLGLFTGKAADIPLRPRLRAGFAMGDITPKKALYLPGKPFNRLSQGTSEQLSVRALVLDDGNVCVALVSLDLIGFSYVDVKRIRQHVRDIFPDENRVVIASTHTHSSPDVLGIWSDSRLDGSPVQAYIAEIIRQSARTIREAYLHRVFLGLANDELGYILPPGRYAEKLYAYERSLAVNATIGSELLDAIRELRDHIYVGGGP